MTTISDERLAEIVGAGTPCVPIEPWEVTHVVQELRSIRAQGGVRVKLLEWSNEPPYSVARVAAMRLFYSIEAVWDDGVFQHVELRGGFVSGDFATVEAAKAAAQVDYERRILSSLEASPAPVSGAMVEARPELTSEPDVLSRLAEGDRIVFSSDGEDAWFQGGDRAFIDGSLMIDLHLNQYIETVNSGTDEDYCEWAQITDLGRAALAAKGGQ